MGFYLIKNDSENTLRKPYSMLRSLLIFAIFCTCYSLAQSPGKQTPKGLITHGGNAKGAPCVFPFVYKNRRYKQCTADDHTAKWCATTHNYDRDGKWGECPIEDANEKAETGKTTPHEDKKGTDATEKAENSKTTPHEDKKGTDATDNAATGKTTPHDDKKSAVPACVNRPCPASPITIEKIRKVNITTEEETTDIVKITKECEVKTKTSIVDKTTSESRTEKDETVILCQREPLDCLDLYERNPDLPDGVYTIYPLGIGNPSMEVYCERGYTVIQRRFNGDVSFDQKWESYDKGFGDLNKEHWLGLANINLLTTVNDVELVVEVEDVDGITKIANYELFKVMQSPGYKLYYQGYSGTAGNAFDAIPNYSQQDQSFSTSDHDQDASEKNCSALFGGNGGWWYGDCFENEANLNGGKYTTENTDGIFWFTVNPTTSLKASKMMIRRKKF